jgi:hypothetical protein
MAPSTFNTVRLNVRNVNPLRPSTRGSQPSGIRSSVKNGSRSATLPPKIVSSVEELLVSIRFQLSNANTKNEIRNALRAAEQLVELVQCEVGVSGSSLGTAFSRITRQIGFCEDPISILVLTGGRSEEVLDKREVWLSLVWVVFVVLSWKVNASTFGFFYSTNLVNALVNDASCSIPLCKLTSAKSQLSYERWVIKKALHSQPKSGHKPFYNF